MAGRKTKLTEKLIKNAGDLIKLGNYTTTVCQYLGIDQTTWYRWIREGKTARSGLKKQFYQTIKESEAHAEIRNVGILQKAVNDDWHAASWYLERKFPERWGRRDRIDANLNHQGEIRHKVDLSLLSDKELDSLETIARKLTDSDGDQSGESSTKAD
jgi:hypothetical protein